MNGGKNKMFKIYDGREQFYQWDIDRKLIVNDNSITQVHFCNKTDECSLVCETYTENGLTLVNVPNVLLQMDWRINVYAYDTNYTKYSKSFNVVKRSKPENYIYTETETLNYNALLERVENLEENGGSAVDLSDYVKNTDFATRNNAGIIKTQASLGFYVSPEGELSIVQATGSNIDAKTNKFNPITPNNLDYAIKKGLTNNTYWLNVSEKVSAHNWLGTYETFTKKTELNNAIAETGYKEVRDESAISISMNNEATVDFTIEIYPAVDYDLDVPLMVSYYTPSDDLWREATQWFTIPAGSEAAYFTLCPEGEAESVWIATAYDEYEPGEQFERVDDYNMLYIKDAYKMLKTDKVFAKEIYVVEDETYDDETGETYYTYTEVATQKDIGAIETALDKIIELQESYIGGNA